MTVEEAKTRIPIATLEQEKKELHKFIVGQDEAIDAFANLEAQLKSGIRSTKPGPLDVKFLAGPSGVGKTELVLAFADLLAGNVKGREQVIVINGAEYQQEHTISRLFGSPPGYVGSRGTGNYIEPVLSSNNLNKHKIEYIDNTGKKRNAIIILIDEAEKANLALHYALLSVLDKGKMNMADNNSVDFSDAIILYTSNVGNQEVEKYRRKAEKLEELSPVDIVTAAFKDVYPPEYQGRINEVIIFKELTPEEVKIITQMKVKEVERVFAANGISLRLDLSSEALDWLIAKGYKPAEGVRSMAKVINRHILDQLRIANGGVSLDKKIIYVDVDTETGGLAFYGNGDIPNSVITESKTTSVKTERTEIDQEILERFTREFDEAAQIPESVSLYDTAFIKDMALLATANIIPDREIVLRHPVIVAKAKLFIKSSAEKGLQAYCNMRERMGQYGVLENQEIKELNADPQVIDIFKESLKKALGVGLKQYISVRHGLVSSGIGTVEYWDETFKDERMQLAKGIKQGTQI